VFRIGSWGPNYGGKVLTQKYVIRCLKMALKCSKPQFSKLGPTTKMALQVDSSNFFHPERIEIYEKQYNDPIVIIHALVL
jgi:hypothetical protein